MAELLRVLWSLRPVLQVRTTRSAPVTIGERQVVGVARSVLLGFGRTGSPVAAGWVRTWPAAVLDTWRGHTRRIPIHDPTRTALLAMAAALFFVALSARYARSNKRLRSIE